MEFAYKIFPYNKFSTKKMWTILLLLLSLPLTLEYCLQAPDAAKMARSMPVVLDGYNWDSGIVRTSEINSNNVARELGRQNIARGDAKLSYNFFICKP
jgi:hypothetical protein